MKPPLFAWQLYGSQNPSFHDSPDRESSPAEPSLSPIHKMEDSPHLGSAIFAPFVKEVRVVAVAPFAAVEIATDVLRSRAVSSWTKLE